jgi:hypothetical protein
MPSRLGQGKHWCPSCHHSKCGHGVTFKTRQNVPEDSHEFVCKKNTPKGCHNSVWDNADARGYMTQWEECKCTREFDKD